MPELTAKQKEKLPPALQKAILAKQAKSKDANKKNDKNQKKEGKMYK